MACSIPTAKALASSGATTTPSLPTMSAASPTSVTTQRTPDAIASQTTLGNPRLCLKGQKYPWRASTLLHHRAALIKAHCFLIDVLLLNASVLYWSAPPHHQSAGI